MYRKVPRWHIVRRALNNLSKRVGTSILDKEDIFKEIHCYFPLMGDYEIVKSMEELRQRGIVFILPKTPNKIFFYDRT